MLVDILWASYQELQITKSVEELLEGPQPSWINSEMTTIFHIAFDFSEFQYISKKKGINLENKVMKISQFSGSLKLIDLNSITE